MTGESDELLNYALMKALSQKERVLVFAILCERIASPKEIADELGEKLSQVSYHVRVLKACGLIAKDRDVQRRGAIQHFYRANVPTLIPPNTWDHLPPALRRNISLSIVQQFFEDASASMRIGTFDDPLGELGWIPLILDRSGLEELGQLTDSFVESVLKLQAKTDERLRKKSNKARGRSAATVFLASFLSARSVREGKKASAAQRR